MALQNSGQITLNQIHKEAGGVGATQSSLNDADIRGLIGKASGAQMAMSEWYGASASIADFSVDKPKGSNYYLAYGVGYGSAGGISNGNNWNCTANSQQGSVTEVEFYGSKYFEAGKTYQIDFDVYLYAFYGSFGAIRIGQGYRDYDGFDNHSYKGVNNTKNLLSNSNGAWSGAVDGVGDVALSGGGESRRHAGSLLYTATDTDVIATVLVNGGSAGFANGQQNIYSLTIKEV